MYFCSMILMKKTKRTIIAQCSLVSVLEKRMVMFSFLYLSNLDKKYEKDIMIILRSSVKRSFRPSI